MPATIEELEGFLRSKTARGRFPEKEFDSFVQPFLTKKHSSRLEELKAKNAAALVLGKMVALGHSAFDKEIDRRGRPIDIWSDQFGYAADRESTFRHYQKNNHRFFLKFQEMLMQVLGWAKACGRTQAEANRILNSNYGISSDFGMVWVRDRGGIVPVPYNHGALGRTIYQADVPYGYWVDLCQRDVVVINGSLVDPPGIFISLVDGVCKLVKINGAPRQFVMSAIKAKTFTDDNNEADEAFMFFLKNTTVFQSVAGGGSYAFIPMPDTTDEQKEFEVVFLEELLDRVAAGGSEAVFAEAFLSKYVESFDWCNPDAEELLEQEAYTPAIMRDKLNHHFDTFYLDTVKERESVKWRKLARAIISMFEVIKKEHGRLGVFSKADKSYESVVIWGDGFSADRTIFRLRKNDGRPATAGWGINVASQLINIIFDIFC